MKKNFLTAAFFLLTFALTSSAQLATPEYKRYDWEAEPKPHTLTEKETKETAVVFLDKRMFEYAYNSQGDLTTYVTRHKIIKLNTDKSIEENNTVYIPMGSVVDMMELKARVISKDGKITVLEKKNIKDVDNYDNAGPFKIFAFEGVELGSEVEYLYTVKKFIQTMYWGAEILQTEQPRKNVEMTIICPTGLKIEAKTYNTTAEFSSPKTEDGKRTISLKMSEIVPFKAELYSGGEANKIRVEYKLAYSEARGKDRILSWNDAAELFYKQLVITNKKEKSKVTGLLKKMKIDKKASEEEKIRKIESYVKTNFAIKEGYADEYESVVFIEKNKFGNTKGMLKIFVEAFKQLDIATEIVMTTDRFRKKFDGDFDTWNYLDEYLLYFPSIDKFLMPGSMFSRLGYVPSEYTCTDGLFIKGVEIGDVVSGVGKVKNIPCLNYKSNYDNIDASVKFENDFTETSIHVKRTFTGYGAMSLQGIYSYLPEEDKKKTIDQILKFISEDSKISNPVIINTDEASVMQKPLIIEGDVKTASLLEKAGDKYLFKVGMVIGPQSELYSEEKRVTDAENESNHGYTRVIVFEIPEGYKVTNLEALSMNVACVDSNGTRSAEFISTYKIEGNKIIVTVEENYKKVIFPLAQFEDFRKVINAAADFNKIVLYFEKK